MSLSMFATMLSAPSQTASRPGPSRRADYARFVPLALRLLENDIFGHVNNAHYYSLFDTTVCDFLVRHGILTWGRLESGLRVVMAESGCRYHSEISFPDPIEGGLAVTRITERSVRYRVAVFRQGAETASADGFMVHVCIDGDTRRPVPIPPSWRKTLTSLVVED